MANEPRFVKFGPEATYRAMRPKAYLALGQGVARVQLGSDTLIGEPHASLRSFEAEVIKIRQELDEALEQAKEYFQSAGQG